MCREAVRAVCGECTLLQCLLSAVFGRSDGCRMLELLNLSWCDQITRDGIEALARGCNAVRAMFLRGCTQVTADCCISSLHHVQSFFVSFFCLFVFFPQDLCYISQLCSINTSVVALTSWKTPSTFFSIIGSSVVVRSKLIFHPFIYFPFSTLSNYTWRQQHF